MKHIAEIAQVSPSTVSNVLHGRVTKMTKETLERVQRAIRDNNYVSNMSGRTLGKYGSKIIGIVMIYNRRDELNAMQAPFFSEIIGSLEHEIRTRGYFMMLYISADAEESLRMARSWNTEGIIVIGGNAEDCHIFMQGTTIPLVFIDQYLRDGGARYNNIGLQDWQGAYMMTEYLIGQGHKRIAFLADQKVPIGVDHERLQGCKTAMEDHGLSFLPEDYIYVNYLREERHRDLKRFIEKRGRHYSALFFASDYLAADSMNLFQDNGVRIPQDISVSGFDDNVFALQARPRLTTVKQDVSQKAFHAINQVLTLIRKEKPEQNQILLPVSLTIRDSVAKK
ncbi:LacI family DNA-binding transcriptional regulator [Treponema primitia]|uniref:LacI family DNA-binding transcriptional regulator n=1 Tax=Treponema primitia TaxID=88058 RepID=UPI0018E1BA8B|nr:LacI family DNA-binding transcriptional regulator [Treponema primitia]